MKKFLMYLVLVLVLLGGLLRYSIEFPAAQNTVMEQMARAAMTNAARGLPEPDSLRVFVCGSASPLGNSDQAQACIAILTPGHFYVIDSGAGSTANLSAAGFPYQRLQAVLLTHFHSDHIAEIYELNLASWVRGRPAPLQVVGPKGIDDIVDGINDTYEQDRQYRVEHHGTDLLPPDLGELSDKRINPGDTITDGDLTIRAYLAAHDPAKPAVGYRIDYRGRSVVVSGDSLVTAETRTISGGVDLLLHDALSVPIVTELADAAEAAGLDRATKIMRDVLDYHADTDSLLELGQQSDIGMIAFYHLVPVPQNMVMEKVFERGFTDKFVLAKDGDWFELPVGSNTILVNGVD